MSLLTRKRSILAKIEGVYGTDPVPTGAANAILISNLNINPMESTLLPRDNIKPYLGNNASLLAACYAKVDYEVELAGSGTAGTAPAYGPLLRACGFSETALALAVTGTAQAGSTSTITLAAAGSSAVDNAYAGMTIRTIAGTGPGQYGVIKSYVGATKVATMTADWAVTPDVTTTYSIDQQVVYLPVSTGFESVTQYFNVDGVIHSLTGARGSVSFAMADLTIPKMKFSFTGLYVPVADAAAPTVTLTAFQIPLAINNVNTLRPVVMGYASSMLSDLSLDIANTVVFRSLVGGSESVIITDRKPAGSLTQEATTVAAKNWWASIKAVTLGLFSITHGITAGNIVKIDAPQMQMTTPTYTDKDGIQMMQTKLDFIPAAGNDEITISVM